MIIDLLSFDHHVSGGRPIYLLHTRSIPLSLIGMRGASLLRSFIHFVISNSADDFLRIFFLSPEKTVKKRPSLSWKRRRLFVLGKRKQLHSFKPTFRAAACAHCLKRLLNFKAGKIEETQNRRLDHTGSGLGTGKPLAF